MVNSVSFSDLLAVIQPQAILWDHAGVLKRNEDMHAEARAAVFKDAGENITIEDAKGMLGWGEEGLFKHLQATGKFPKVVSHYKDWKNYKSVHNTIYAKIVASDANPERHVRTGVPEAIAYAHSKAIPMAIVSNSSKDEIVTDVGQVIRLSNIFREKAGFAPITPQQAFAFTISSDDLETRNSSIEKTQSDLANAFHTNTYPIHKKPMPSAFMKAALLLMGEMPERVNDVRKILVIEDTQAEAALRAGMNVVHIYTPGVRKESAAIPHSGAIVWVADTTDFFENMTPNPAKRELAQYLERQMLARGNRRAMDMMTETALTL